MRFGKRVVFFIIVFFLLFFVWFVGFSKYRYEKTVELPSISNVNQDVQNALQVVNLNVAVANEEFATLLNPAGIPIPPTFEIPVSIVIVNFQEKFLAPTVKSLLETASNELINEILIIDDFSQPPAEYEWFPKDRRIRIIRAKNRLGLIKARVTGGNNAQGPMIVLLDAHVKPHDNWLKPIVKMLREDYKQILNMEVGLLDGDNWKQMDGSAIGSKAAFKWDLSHFWENEMNQARIKELSGIDNADVDESPITMGMFASTKKWWNTIGGMDPGLQVWGGENIDISIRTWLCGGRIRVARGSYVDHTFRTKFPYEVRGDIYRRNIVRIAEAWMDPESKGKFYRAINAAQGTVEFGTVQDIKDMQKRIGCKDFSYYVQKFKGRSPI